MKVGKKKKSMTSTTIVTQPMVGHTPINVNAFAKLKHQQQKEKSAI